MLLQSYNHSHAAVLNKLSIPDIKGKRQIPRLVKLAYF